jgi:hypothetical protein
MSGDLPKSIALISAAAWLSKKLGWEMDTASFRELCKDRGIKLRRHNLSIYEKGELLGTDPSFTQNEFPDKWSIAKKDLLALLGDMSSGHNEEEVRRYRQKWLAQEDFILQIMLEMQVNPLSFPKNESGKSGLKSEIRKIASKRKDLFSGSSFNKAWERLRASGVIKDAE